METVTVNAIGEQCPIPVVKAAKALGELAGPGTLEVHVDNEIAVQNVTRLASGKGLPSSCERLDGQHFVVRITVDAPLSAPEEELPVCTPDARGDDELGKTLMKGFLFALTQLRPLPDTVIFYNGGAALTTEGSASLEDLRTLEAQGVTIMTCGTCLNYYGLTERLAVGSVSNMYTIAETLAGAGKVIRP